jgi:hypothetical protein
MQVVNKSLHLNPLPLVLFQVSGYLRAADHPSPNALSGKPHVSRSYMPDFHASKYVTSSLPNYCPLLPHQIADFFVRVPVLDLILLRAVARTKKKRASGEALRRG